MGEQQSIPDPDRLTGLDKIGNVNDREVVDEQGRINDPDLAEDLANVEKPIREEAIDRRKRGDQIGAIFSDEVANIESSEVLRGKVIEKNRERVEAVIKELNSAIEELGDYPTAQEILRRKAEAYKSQLE